ncbi:acyltransferase 3 [Macrophomina phaseolina]|uniref:Acyltransferase 3 n=1 Tax=Macrophomina phaseolina TaxID=35725 RepID=A0ABQ8GRI4_9PEZI|nr:acyltransferase 3 [Macrophomina phaseolina]
MTPVLPQHHKPPAPSPPPSTTWINGLRGIASLIIALNHYLYPDFETPWLGYGSSPSNQHLHQLPLLRLPFSGHGARPLFFVISAYCASFRPIRLRDSRGLAHMAASLSASAFRRPLRLYLPLLFMAAVSQLLLYCGAYAGPALYAATGLRPWAGAAAHLAFLLRYAVDICNPLAALPVNPGLNLQYWVIPLELGGSLACYVTVLALARVAPRVRLAVLAGAVVAPFVWRGSCFTWAFLAGVWVAEVDWLEERGGLCVRRGVRRAVFALGVWLVCLPDNYRETPGYAWCAWVEDVVMRAWGVEAPHNWRSVGAVAVVFGVSGERALQRVFDMRVPQAVARVSWEVYLVHVLVYNVLKEPVRRGVARLLGKMGAVAPENGFLWTEYLISGAFIAVAVWWSARRLKMVNARLVAFTKWLEMAAQDTIL